MKIKLDSLERRVAQKLISKQTKNDLILYNYTQECQFDKKWDKWTTMARGLIVTTDGTVVARPFPKFFNLNETEKTKATNLPAYMPEITEKLDGSLGILYFDGHDYAIATRGSFESEQAQWATAWLKKQGKKDWLDTTEFTYLFEIIYPENNMVVKYGDMAELVLIGVMHTYTGQLWPHTDVVKEANRLGFAHARQYTKTIAELEKEQDESKDNAEGYVLFYPKENLLVKVKLKEYVRINKLIFGITPKAIWENLKYGQNVKELFSDAPDEIFAWIEDWVNKLQLAFDVESRAVVDFATKAQELPTRKEQALWLQKNAPIKYIGAVFAYIDKKDWKHVVWEWVRPAATLSNEKFTPATQQAKRLVVTKGLPASGKSTWAKQVLKEQPGKWKRVNKDDIRAMLDDSKWSPENETFVLAVRDMLVHKALDEGYNVIVDDTNLHPKHLTRMKEIAAAYPPTAVEVQDFSAVPVEECIARDAVRATGVGKGVILNMYRQYFDADYKYTQKPKTWGWNVQKPFAIVCDIDGTLALMGDRSPYDWHSVGIDAVNAPIADIVRTYAQGALCKVILMSGRDGVCRPETEAWLKQHNLPYDYLYMRSAGDHRPDDIIKEELYNAHVKNKYNVLFVLDDRDRVVKLWRGLGLTCLQVNYGNF